MTWRIKTITGQLYFILKLIALESDARYKVFFPYHHLVRFSDAYQYVIKHLEGSVLLLSLLLNFQDQGVSCMGQRSLQRQDDL